MPGIGLELKTMTVDFATEVAVRGIMVGQEWRIVFGEELHTAIDMIIEEALDLGYERSEITMEIQPHPTNDDGVIVKLVRDDLIESNKK